MLGSASLISLIFTLLFQAGSISQSRVSGIVIDPGPNSSQPLYHARVELQRDSELPKIVRTERDGTFEFADLSTGAYRLIVTVDGYLRKSVPIAVGTGQQRDRVLVVMDAAPTIVGTIKTQNNIPIPKVMVEAMKVVYGPRGDRSVVSVASTMSDDRGEFHLYWLDTGDYYIRAWTVMPKPNTAISDSDGQESSGPIYGATYYPGFGDPVDGTRIHLRVGTNVRLGDFKVQPADTVGISGHVSVEATGEPAGARITLEPAGQVASSQQFHGKAADNLPSVPDRTKGEYAIGGLPPGTYIISAQFESGGKTLFAARKVALKVSEGSVNLLLSDGINVNGVLVTEPKSVMDFRSARVELVSTDPDLPSPPPAAVAAAGEFAVAHVPTGEYVVRMLDVPGDAYVKSVKSGDTDIRVQPFRVDREPANPILLVLGVDGGRIDGLVVDDSNSPTIGSRVVLVPDTARRRFSDQYRLAESDGAGRFTLRGIPPGDYRLFAWKYIEPNAYLDSTFMASYESLGVAVAVPSGGSDNATLRVIPLD